MNGDVEGRTVILEPSDIAARPAFFAPFRRVRVIRTALYSCGAVALAFTSANTARADVMELDATGARWVAGGSGSGPVGAPDAGGLSNSSTNPQERIGPGSVTALPSPIIGGFVGSVAANPLSATHPIASDTRIVRVPHRYAAKVRELAQRFDLSENLIEALVWQESRWRESAVSHAGARGLAQLMPGTARDLGVDPDDPLQNLEGGARYLREQLDRFDGNLEKALAAYNAGPGRVMRADGIPDIRETRDYVTAILGRLSDHSLSRAR